MVVVKESTEELKTKRRLCQKCTLFSVQYIHVHVHNGGNVQDLTLGMYMYMYMYCSVQYAGPARTKLHYLVNVVL